MHFNKYFFYRLFIIMALFAIFIAVFTEIRAKAELDVARNYRDQDERQAGLHYFRALNWYAPWGSSQIAADELFDIGCKMLYQGKKVDAFHIFLQLRSGLMAARSFYVPRNDILTKINPIISAILAERRLGERAPKEELDKLTEVYLNLYNNVPGPKKFWIFFVDISFLSWVGLAIYCIFFIADRPVDIKNNTRLKYIILLFIFNYLLWLNAMRLA